MDFIHDLVPPLDISRPCATPGCIHLAYRGKFCDYCKPETKEKEPHMVGKVLLWIVFVLASFMFGDVVFHTMPYWHGVWDSVIFVVCVLCWEFIP